LSTRESDHELFEEVVSTLNLVWNNSWYIQGLHFKRNQTEVILKHVLCNSVGKLLKACSIATWRVIVPTCRVNDSICGSLKVFAFNFFYIIYFDSKNVIKSDKYIQMHLIMILFKSNVYIPTVIISRQKNVGIFE